MAWPMPEVEPVTSAALPERSMFISVVSIGDEGDIGSGACNRNRRSTDGDAHKKSGAQGAAFENQFEEAYAASAAFSCTGPESRPLASTSRSTNSITAIGALSP